MTRAADPAADWSRYDVPAVWAMLRDEGGSEAWAQVTAWRRTYELLAYHRLAVQRGRDELAAAWPPERGTASAVFLDYLDGLLASMDATSHQAVANAEALTGVLTALDTAKRDVGALYERWRRYESAEQEQTVVPGLVPITIGPSVPDDWRDELNGAARSRMVAAEQEVSQSAARLQVPDVFAPGVQADEPGTPWPPAADAPAARAGDPYRAPLIAPPTGYRAGDPSGAPALAGAHAVPGPAPVAAQPGDTTGPAPPVVDRLGTFGPVLGLPTGYPAAISAEPPAGTRSAAEPRGSVPPRSAAEPVTAAGRRSGGAVDAEHGAVLGGIPGGAAYPHPTSTASHVPPVRYRWSVPTGVPPVLTPPPEPREHDPGPAVIGIDR